MSRGDRNRNAGREPTVAEEQFDAEVRAALARREAPDGFTERVMARAAQQQDTGPRRRGKLMRFTPRVHLAYAAAALLAVTASAVGVQHHREARRAAEATEQFDVAMQVTGDALAHVSAQLERTKLGAVERALATSTKEKE